MSAFSRRSLGYFGEVGSLPQAGCSYLYAGKYLMKPRMAALMI